MVPGVRTASQHRRVWSVCWGRSALTGTRQNVTLTRVVSFAVVAGVLALGIARIRDPRRTPLPFGQRDLSSVQRQLDALPDSERALVVGYVQRSGGDLLPPKFADPDAPLTARTFGEAIALQRRFLAGQAVVDAQTAARRRARDAALAPLRAALEVELVGREIVPRERLYTRVGPDLGASEASAKRAIDDTPVLVTTFRLRNATRLTVDSLKGRVDVRGPDRGPPLFSMLTICFLDHRETLAPGQSTDIRCVNGSGSMSVRDSAYLATPERDIVLDWKPTAIMFADGTSLEYKGD